MGSGIAAHLAGCGVPVLLLDIVPKYTDADRAKEVDASSSAFRSRLALDAIEKCKKGRPTPAFYHSSAASLVTAGNLEDDFDQLGEVDWIIEVVVERLDIKRDLFARIAKVRKPDAVISSNTSGLSAAEMTAELDLDFKRHFLITHFFNPVRHMRLLEIVALLETDPRVVADMAEFGERVLGKGVVYAKDTPNFIANRIGIYSTLSAFRDLGREGFTVEEVDAIFGPALARPKSASFKTGDLVGIDTLLLVCNHVLASCKHDKELSGLEVPEFLPRMVEKGLLGNKVKQGFYKKEKGPDGKTRRLVLDLETLEYRELKKPKFASVSAAKGIADVKARFRAMLNHEDRAGKAAWMAMSSMMVYVANIVNEIADDIYNVDRAMRGGYNWELGPFESWDANGVKETAERLRVEGREVPALVERLLARGAESFYKEVDGILHYWCIRDEQYRPLELSPRELPLSRVKGTKGGVLRRNPGADLLDLGDGILGLEFHTKMNALDDDVLKQAENALELLEGNDWQGVVITNEGSAFSAGANVMAVAMMAMSQNWDALEQLIRGMQALTLRMKYFHKPVVAAPFGLTLGGGAEIMMASQRIQAHAELYCGLVELGVGLVPAGGGCKELLFRYMTSLPEKTPVEPFHVVQRVFELIGQAQVSLSAAEAKARGFLAPTDRITANRYHLTADAKMAVLHMIDDGFRPAPPTTIPVAGRTGFGALKVGIEGFKTGGYISAYDAKLGTHVARILTGGDVADGTRVDEQHILDLEREAFLSLCGEPKTMERIQHLLSTGRPLRN
jgi:3-hydroxyacyl-CoA dehydrogenase